MPTWPSPTGQRLGISDTPAIRSTRVSHFVFHWFRGTLLPGSPADFGKLIADDTEKWGKVIRSANIKL